MSGDPFVAAGTYAAEEEHAAEWSDRYGHLSRRERLMEAHDLVPADFADEAEADEWTPTDGWAEPPDEDER